MKPAKSANDLISTNERVMVEARKKYYENTNNKKIVQTGQYIGLKILHEIFEIQHFILGKKVLPAFILLFSFLYWGYGLGHYFD